MPMHRGVAFTTKRDEVSRRVGSGLKLDHPHRWRAGIPTFKTKDGAGFAVNPSFVAFLFQIGLQISASDQKWALVVDHL